MAHPLRVVVQEQHDRTEGKRAARSSARSGRLWTSISAGPIAASALAAARPCGDVRSRRASGGGAAGGRPIQRRAPRAAPDPAPSPDARSGARADRRSSAMATAASGEILPGAARSATGALRSPLRRVAGGPDQPTISMAAKKKAISAAAFWRCRSRGPIGLDALGELACGWCRRRRWPGWWRPSFAVLRDRVSPSSTCTTTGPDVMNVTRSRKKAALAMHAVERLGLRSASGAGASGR